MCNLLKIILNKWCSLPNRSFGFGRKCCVVAIHDAVLRQLACQRIIGRRGTRVGRADGRVCARGTWLCCSLSCVINVGSIVCLVAWPFCWCGACVLRSVQVGAAARVSVNRRQQLCGESAFKISLSLSFSVPLHLSHRKRCVDCSGMSQPRPIVVRQKPKLNKKNKPHQQNRRHLTRNQQPTQRPPQLMLPP